MLGRGKRDLGKPCHASYHEDWHPETSLSFPFSFFFPCHPHSFAKQRRSENTKTMHNGMRKASQSFGAAQRGSVRVSGSQTLLLLSKERLESHLPGGLVQTEHSYDGLGDQAA